jgi:hypothetical protein
MKNTAYLILFFTALLIGIGSCKNNDEVFVTFGPAHINVVNAGTDTLNFYLNGTRQNNASSIYPGGQSLYLPVPDGKQNYEVKKIGSATFLFSVPLTTADSSYTSLYVYGETASQSFTTGDVLLSYLAHPDTTQIRFVNVSQDAGNLTVTVGDTVRFASQPFKSSTAFALTGGGSKEVKIFQAGAASPLKDTSIVFQPGGIYTLFSKGLLNGKGNAAFGFGVVYNGSSLN